MTHHSVQTHEVQVIAKSSCEGCPDITTVRLRYWRPIHAELMTHRIFSRNASSSRAVPVEKLAKSTEDSIFVPKFRKNKPGMQPGDPLAPIDQAYAYGIWNDTAHVCLRAARELSDPNGLNVHKQWANRMMEWFGFINVLVTSTEWNNFFSLRLETNPDGTPVPQDEMYDLACTLNDRISRFPARKLKPGEWHLPWILEDERIIYSDVQQKRISAARSASISYETVDGKPMDASKALTLCDKLMEKKHYSPFEHQAMADQRISGAWAHRSLHANFQGWAQWRKLLEEQR